MPFKQLFSLDEKNVYVRKKMAFTQLFLVDKSIMYVRKNGIYTFYSMVEKISVWLKNNSIHMIFFSGKKDNVKEMFRWLLHCLPVEKKVLTHFFSFFL
jgi:hypothetical protein